MNQATLRKLQCYGASKLTKIGDRFFLGMSKTIIPARRIKPGRILQRELEARGWSQQDLAALTNLSLKTISKIIIGTEKIEAATAKELSTALETTREFWINLEINYQN